MGEGLCEVSFGSALGVGELEGFGDRVRVETRGWMWWVG